MINNHGSDAWVGAVGIVVGVVALVVALIIALYYGAGIFKEWAAASTAPSTVVVQHEYRSAPDQAVRTNGPSFKSLPAPPAPPDGLDCDAYYIDHGFDPKGHCKEP